MFFVITLNQFIGGVFMADTLKNRVRVSYTLSKETYERLQDYSASHIVTTTRLVDRAISEYIDRMEKSEGKE